MELSEDQRQNWYRCVTFCAVVFQVMMAMPAFGTTVNPTIIRRLCLATAVAIITWTVWKHTDSDLEILR